MRNEIQHAFADVKAGEHLKNSTKSFLQQQREIYSSDVPDVKAQEAVSCKANQRKNRKNIHRMLSPRKAMLAACAMVVLLIGAGSYSFLLSPAYYVSIDVNPSVELTLNQVNRVISARAYNEDGQIVLKGVSVKGTVYTDAIDMIVESDAMQPYLTEDAALTFTVAANNDAQGDQVEAIQAGISESNSCRRHGGKSVAADMETYQEAHANHLSFGKYNAFMELKKYDSSVTVEQCHHMSMAEINQQIGVHENMGEEENCQNESDQEDETGQHKHHHGGL